MLKIGKEHVNDHMSRDLAPAAVCKSGDMVIFETRDCYDDCVISEERPLGEREDALENPATGPLFIEGASAGDVLKVEILDIALRSYGVMRSSTSAGAFVGTYETREARIFDLSGGEIVFDEHLTLPVTPMIGVIGTAPQEESIPNSTPGAHGGNMDCKKIGKGSTLYLPVCTDGALLSMGDLHALMGDGEVFICGMETAGEITVRVTVLKASELPTPFLVSGDRVMTIQSAQTLDEASALASRKMFAWIQSAFSMDALRAGMLMSLQADLAVCQIVDPLQTVRCELSRDILEAYGAEVE